MTNTDPNHWFLSPDQMPRQPHFSTGNLVTTMVDGAAYMNDLRNTLGLCDQSVFISGWRVSSEQVLNPGIANGVVVGDRFIDAVRNVRTRNAEIRALIFNVLGTTAPAPFRKWHADDNRIFCEGVNASGGEGVLDNRVSLKPISSHHQKFIVTRSNNPFGNVAYVGGIDVCLDRWDQPAHDSPLERLRDFVPIGNSSRFFPSQPGWHDVHASVRGPAVQQVWQVFKDRWNDPRPENPPGLEAFRRRTLITGSGPSPATIGSHAVQVYQTLPCGVFGPGEQTVRLAHEHAIDQAQHYIYIEDQYLWPCSLTAKLVAALQRGVFVVILVARDYDLPGLSFIHRLMRQEVIDTLRAANPAQPELFKIFHLEQPNGEQIYVHAKTMIVDDCFASIGSANFNLRSMTNDTELQIGVVDTTTRTVPMGSVFNLQTVCNFANDYRCNLWGEHFGVPAVTLLDPITSIQFLWSNAPVVPLRRVIPHQPVVPSLDIDQVADFFASLVILGISNPPFLQPFLQPVLIPLGGLVGEQMRAPIKAAIVSALGFGGQSSVAVNFLKDLLNPVLVC